MIVTGSSSNSTLGHRGLPRAALPLGAAVLLALVGCGSSGKASSGSTSSVSQVATVAKAALDKQSAPIVVPADPGPAINTKALVGKTIFYVPLVLKADYFQLIEKTLREGLSKANVKMQACDGQANPSGIKSCLDQAITANAAAVVTDYIPYELAPTAFDKVRSAGIPVYVGDEIAPAGISATPKFAFNDPDQYQNATMDGIMNAVIADSNGKAHLLFVTTQDDAAVARAQAHAIAYVKQACPDCVLTVKRASIATIQNVPSLVSSALLGDPSIKYVVPQYDSYLAPAIAGVQSAGRVRDIKLASANASLANLPAVKTNPQVLAAVGHDATYSGWALADAALRLMTGQQPPAKYPVPVRAFTKANIGDLQLTPEQEASGGWYGDAASYQKAFKKLWGVW